MPKKLIDELVDQQRGWLDPLGKDLASFVRQTGLAAGPTGQKVLDFLYGVWLGHPLHAALTDVPVGAWTAAAMMDAWDLTSPSEPARRCADAAVGVGLAGGVGAAFAGLADWHHTSGHTRRLGLTHGLLNATILLLYGTSLAMRRGKTRPAGVSLGLLAYSLASLSAYIGGELVYEQGMGVDHALFEKPPKDFVPVLAEADLPEGKPTKVSAKGASVVLFKQGGRIRAIGHVCTHMGGPLAEGKVEDDAVVCPWHGSRFALEDGSVVRGPATFPELAYDVRVRDGQVEVRPRP